MLPDLGGYVLAGGKSSRMGQDKAVLELAGKPLIVHALTKLRRLCSSVAILSDNPGLSSFGPLVQDLHPGCGPMSGMEAALAHSATDWNLIIPVDVPFLPTSLLAVWAEATLRHGRRDGTRISMYRVEEINQPAILMLHRDVAPYLTVALARGEYKLGPVLHAAAEDLAATRGLAVPTVLRKWLWTAASELSVGLDPHRPEPWRIPTEAQQQARDLWFANLNTPGDFAAAKSHTAALDT